MGGVRIGSLLLPHGLMLAPMAGVTDASFRGICRKEGAEYTVTEMISAKALCYEQRGRASAPAKTAALAKVYATDVPIAVQIFGSEPEYMASAAALLASGTYRGAEQAAPFSAIDINMGCPVAKVVSNHEGSALMKEPQLAARIVRAVRDAVDIPVTVKIRAGWDETRKNAAELAQMLEAAGADLITVHGRTRGQFYAPKSDNSVIAAVKKSVHIPVIGNGDLFSSADVLHMMEETGCDGVMIARGALGNPFLFREILAALDGKPYTPPTWEERLDTAVRHAADMIEKKGEKVGLSEARKHLAWYCKGARGAAAARDALMRAACLSDIRDIFSRFLKEESDDFHSHNG